MSKVVLNYQRPEKPDPGDRTAVAGSWFRRHVGDLAFALVLAVAWALLVGWLFVPAGRPSLRLTVMAAGWLPEAAAMFAALAVARRVRGATGAMKFSLLWGLL